jgi:B9 domain-containing protein 1
LIHDTFRLFVTITNVSRNFFGGSEMINGLQMSSAELVLSVQGQIMSCQADFGSELFCRFEFHAGSDWTIISGAEDGISQIARLGADHKCTWNYPIEVVFKSSKPFGWPQVICCVYGQNFLGAQIVVGYGLFHLPTSAGHHVFNVPLFARWSTVMQKIRSVVTGAMPELIRFNFLAGGESREALKTESHGHIRVAFDVVISGLKKLDLIVQVE